MPAASSLNAGQVKSTTGFSLDDQEDWKFLEECWSWYQRTSIECPVCVRAGAERLGADSGG
jgi:hypothetical protein